MSEGIYVPSGDVVAREVAGDFVIIPVTSGIGDAEDELFTLNETGQAIWQKLDGVNSLCQVAQLLAEEYEAQASEIEVAVIGLIDALYRRGLVVELADA